MNGPHMPNQVQDSLRGPVTALIGFGVRLEAVQIGKGGLWLLSCVQISKVPGSLRRSHLKLVQAVGQDPLMSQEIYWVTSRF